MNLLNELIFHAEKKPKKLAILAKDYTYTFQELLVVTQKCRNFLQQKKIKEFDLVGLNLGKTRFAYPLMLATMSLGATYFNLDPDSPFDRTTRILKISRPKLVIFGAGENSFSATQHSQYAHVDELEEFVSAKLGDPISKVTVFNGEFINYVMFTSGSSGFPKGVKIRVSSVRRFHEYWRKRLSITGNEVFSGLNSLHFDNSVFDFFNSIFNGCTLSIFSSRELENPLEVTQRFQAEKINLWFSVPSTIILFQYSKTMSIRHLPFLKYIVFGGEGFPKSMLKMLFEEFSSSTELINVYGPTEGTCICSDYRVTLCDFNDMSELCPLGIINEQFIYEIHDLNENRISSTKKGELVLGGQNVSPGYLNNEKNNSFFTNGEGMQFYRTGDIVSLDGEVLKFHGRADNQVKIRGHRVELEEIEHIIRGIAAVSDCAVVPIEGGPFGTTLKLLVKTDDPKIHKSLAANLVKILPSYMRPSSTKYVTQIPLNANGKIDRKSLAQML